MLLDALRNFEWLNEPQEFAFSERGLKITARPQTDFWQDKIGGYNKDDGHFFYGYKKGTFELTTRWRCGIPTNFAQCGLMGRINEHVWFKISLFSKNGTNMNICCVVTDNGSSDMSLTPISGVGQEIWFRLKHNNNGVCELLYSQNGITFVAVRRFCLSEDNGELQNGAFICAPSENHYTAVLMSIDYD